MIQIPSHSVFRAASLTTRVARRGLHATPSRMSSPYHYPEGPRSNIPFNPLTKYFALRYWTFMGGQDPKLNLLMTLC
jgi:cytochrome c oxidase subunit 7c